MQFDRRFGLGWLPINPGPQRRLPRVVIIFAGGCAQVLSFSLSRLSDI